MYGLSWHQCSASHVIGLQVKRGDQIALDEEYQEIENGDMI
jgi:hypothetical protein